MNPAQRKIAIAVAAAGLLALLIAGGLFSDGLRRAYHLARLRRQPVLLESLLVSEDPALEAACRDFVREPEGKRELLALFLWEFERTMEYPTRKAIPRPADPSSLPRFLKDMLASPTDRAAITLWEKGHSLSSFRGASGASTYSMSAPPQDEARRRKILAIIEACAGDQLELPGSPGIALVVTPAEALRAWCAGGPEPPYVDPRPWKDRLSSICSAIAPEAKHVCLLTIDRGAAPFQPQQSG